MNPKFPRQSAARPFVVPGSDLEHSVQGRRQFLALASAALLAGCGLPQQGPQASAVLQGAEQFDYLLLPVDDAITRQLGQPPASGFGGLVLDPAAVPSDAVGIGDRLAIRVLEAGDGGLFAAPNGGAGGTDFPDVMVDRNGQVTLPYVGALKVNGLTPAQIQTLIVEQLTGKAIEPQALVRILQSKSNEATITGDVARPGPFNLSLRGDRLSDVIAAAGGARNPAHETRVTMLRKGRRSTAVLQDILLTPSNDIQMQRGDLIVLTHQPPRYTLTGAVIRPSTYEIAAGSMSVLEAVSDAGGANDGRASASGVFLLRFEPRERLHAAGLTGLERYPYTQDGVPTVYRFDMTDPKTLFHATTFRLTDGDAIYVANASSVSLNKLLTLFNVGIGAANAAQSVSE